MMNKLAILMLAVRKIRNWQILPKVYFGIHKKEFFHIELKNGIKLKLRTNSTDIHAFVNVWLLEEYRSGKEFLKNANTIIDIGSHIGLFCIYASQYCKYGKIYCYEPVKKNYNLLEENIRMNNLENINLHNLAVSENNSKLKIFLDKDDDAAHGIYGNSEDFIEADSTSLQSILDSNNIEKCDFLKLDCEGSEYDILEALSNDSYKKIEKIILEYHDADTRSKELEKMKENLKKLGYEISDRPSIGGMGILTAE